MIIAGWVVVGFFSAIGWWGANHYVIEPYFPEPIVKEKKVDTQQKLKDQQ